MTIKFLEIHSHQIMNSDKNLDLRTKDEVISDLYDNGIFADNVQASKITKWKLRRTASDLAPIAPSPVKLKWG